ncbi:MAG: NAD(+) synthetase, partial [Candidatus Sabulitectum sp.]|nr:NAD(+) synthetase [Candidatus Sabulitectum sp.]
MIYAELTDKITGWIKERVYGAGVKGVVIGLSGGIDSGVTAALCVRALGAENVLGLIMPCE